MANPFSPALKQQMLEQLAEQTKRGAIVDSQIIASMLAAVFVAALSQLWFGATALVAEPACEQPLLWWLVCDGAAVCVGMLLGLVAVLKRVQVARTVEAHRWVSADGKERDASGDLTGAFRTVRNLSDGVDVLIIAGFACGCYFYWRSGGAETPGCDGAGRNWVRWALVLKLVVPLVVSLVAKAVLYVCAANPKPPPAQAQERKRK